MNEVAVHYRFFLTPTGSDIFEAWAEIALKTMGEFDGFLGLDVLSPVDGNEENHIVCRFECEAQAWEFALSDEHIRLLEGLDGHHLRPWKNSTYRVRRFQRTSR